MKLFKAIAGISAIFILGALTGVLGTSLFFQHRIETLREKGPPPIKPLFMQRMTGQLELTLEQKKAVGNILEQTQQQLVNLRKQYRPRIREIFSTCFTRIEEKLQPEQRARFKEIKESFPCRRWHKRARGHAGHPPPHAPQHQPPPAGKGKALP
ncbi:MAG: hypothetical protein ACQERN_07965 [Thermodesulfobacteriota bacterium]